MNENNTNSLSSEELEEEKYKPPEPRKLEDILNQDAEDESLQKYKHSLIPAKSILIRPNDIRNVIPIKISLIFENDQPEISFDIDYDTESILEKYLDTIVKIKEKSQYHFCLEFYVQRDIVTGLQYCLKTTNFNKLYSNTTKYMIGSRAPSDKIYVYHSPIEEAPCGMIARSGKFTIKNVLKDDYGQEYLKWKWTLKIIAE